MNIYRETTHDLGALGGASFGKKNEYIYISQSMTGGRPTTFQFVDARVVITTPCGRRLETTPETVSRLGIHESTIVEMHSTQPIFDLLTYARDNVLPRPSVRARVLAVGLCPQWLVKDAVYVMLNVGGVVFKLSRDFLVKHFDYFDALLSRWTPDETEIFVDREGDVFSLIIDGIVSASPAPPRTSKVDADFFGLRGFEERVITAQDLVQKFQEQDKDRSPPTIDDAWNKIQDRLREELRYSSYASRTLWINSNPTRVPLNDEVKREVERRLVETGFTVKQWSDEYVVVTF